MTEICANEWLERYLYATDKAIPRRRLTQEEVVDIHYDTSETDLHIAMKPVRAIMRKLDVSEKYARKMLNTFPYMDIMDYEKALKRAGKVVLASDLGHVDLDRFKKYLGFRGYELIKMGRHCMIKKIVNRS